MKEVHQLVWENKATVRAKPRIVFEKNQGGYFFPLSRQPLSLHPLVEDLGADSLTYLLAQSLYKYTNDFAIIETKVVNQSIFSVMSNSLVIDFSPEQKINLSTIMVDEAYHAYVSFDAMLQIQEHTNIKPLPLPKTIEIELAIKAIKDKLDPLYHGEFELIAVCLAENTLTKEIVAMLDQDETHPFFQQLIHDHLSDESRHAGIFFHLLEYLWRALPEDYKRSIGRILPEFLTLYLSSAVQIEFDTRVLIQLGLTSCQVDEIINDTYGNFQVTQHHPMLKNIISILNKAGVLDEAVSFEFRKKNWL